MSSSTIATIALPADYGYVLFVTALTSANAFWHGMRIGGFRKASGVSYPTPYADSGIFAHASSSSSSSSSSTKDASATTTFDPLRDPIRPTTERQKALYLFNCAQRAHGNLVENLTPFLASMLVAGLKYPAAAAALGLVWNAGRVVYAVGYTRGDRQNGKGRLVGSFFWLAQLGAIGLAGWTGLSVAGLV